MDIQKLAKVMMKTTSPNKNEVLSAIDIANSMLNSVNLTWEDFIAEKTIVIQEVAVDDNAKKHNPYNNTESATPSTRGSTNRRGFGSVYSPPPFSSSYSIRSSAPSQPQASGFRDYLKHIDTPQVIGWLLCIFYLVLFLIVGFWFPS